MPAARVRRDDQNFRSVGIHFQKYQKPDRQGGQLWPACSRVSCDLPSLTVGLLTLLQSPISHVDCTSAGLFLGLLFEFTPSFLHFALEFLNLNQVLRIERQRRIIAIRLVRAETTVGCLLASCFHRRRQPETLKIPVVIAQVSDRREILTRRQSAFVVNHCARRSGVTSQL